MVEDLALAREVVRIGLALPRNVTSGEHRVWLVQPHVVVDLMPHSGRRRAPIDERDLRPRRPPARGEQRIEPRDARTEDTQIALENLIHEAAFRGTTLTHEANPAEAKRVDFPAGEA
jgi:hypothetical protein